MELLMRFPLEIWLDSRSGWWIIEPLSSVQGDLHECDLLRVALETTAVGSGIALMDISVPGVGDVLRLSFETSSATLQLDDLSGVPRDSLGQISGTDFAEPDWFSLEAMRGDLEMNSSRQFYEWVKRD
ncbi:hypothetical protein [Kribbella sp. NPDC004875]|uniref:hypothetical protein n=1 Tax=Kribbella sp. NPDC004875 TaxID=3364107 RepID=UPI003686F033